MNWFKRIFCGQEEFNVHANGLPPVSISIPMPKVKPPKPPLMRVGCNGNPCPLCGSGMKPNWIFFKSKGCYQPECGNYWRSK